MKNSRDNREPWERPLHWIFPAFRGTSYSQRLSLPGHCVQTSHSSRSAFVDLTAWSFMAIGTLGALFGIGQLIFLLVVIPVGQLTAATRELAMSLPWPTWARMMVQYLPHLLLGTVALCALTVWAARALLRRREWARKIFVVMMWLGVVANLFGAVSPFFFEFSIDSILAIAPPEWRGWVGSMLSSSAAAFAWTTASSAIVFAVLFAWTAVVLQRGNVRREFEIP